MSESVSKIEWRRKLKTPQSTWLLTSSTSAINSLLQPRWGFSFAPGLGGGWGLSKRSVLGWMEDLMTDLRKILQAQTVGGQMSPFLYNLGPFSCYHLCFVVIYWSLCGELCINLLGIWYPAWPTRLEPNMKTKSLEKDNSEFLTYDHILGSLECEAYGLRAAEATFFVTKSRTVGFSLCSSFYVFLSRNGIYVIFLTWWRGPVALQLRLLLIRNSNGLVWPLWS